ncbi:trimethylguanosine synthase isoform X2 [Folsomia candida]|uniref:trimethylguanosine synthase isoform X2 n=1 Tax=Folsomia candida TaxID=158441 RepID=UPI000B8FE826|nr:trimethylguanosine synthase isoform X2 [Folsomia candida]
MRKADTQNYFHLPPSSTNSFSFVQDYDDEVLVPQTSSYIPPGKLEADFQLSSDLDEGEESSPAKDYHEEIDELQRICASERFSIQTSEPKHLASITAGASKQKRKRRQGKKKNKLLIKSFSEHFTEDFCVEEEEVQQEENYYWPDPSSEDPAVQKFFKQWEAYWASKGENILWKNSSSSSNEDDYEAEQDYNSTNATMEGLVTKKLSKATRQLLRQRKEQDNNKSKSIGEDELENMNSANSNASLEGLITVKLSEATRRLLKQRKDQDTDKSKSTDEDELENMDNDNTNASMEGLVTVKLSEATRRLLKQRKEQDTDKSKSTDEDELENMDNDNTNATMEGLVTKKLSKPTRQLLKLRKEQDNDKSGLENMDNDGVYTSMEGLVTVKLSEKTRQLLKRKKSKDKSTNRTNEEESKSANEMWQETWDNHCQEEYANEYQKYVKKHMKMRKVSIPCENDPRIRKYFDQRYQLFSKYDEGIKLDYESWFSVTPEMIASHIADRFSILGQSAVILDAFAGCGGNTIQFAKVFDKVIAIDIDPIKIDNCRHNSKIYGVEDKIEFIVGDFMDLAATLAADAVFISPPWGGPAYQSASVFDIETMIPMNGATLFKTAKTISDNIGYFLPRNVDEIQILKLGEGDFVDIEKNYVNCKVKTVTAYFGNLIAST